MRRSYKEYILIIMLIGIFFLTGCNKFRLNTYNASKEEIGTKITLAPDYVPEETEVTPKVEEKSPSENLPPSPTPSAIQPIAKVDLPIYTVNADSGDIEIATALIADGSEITPELIVNHVVESLADQSIIVGIESVTTKGDAVIVSFYKNKAPIADVGAGYEAAILDSIAQSLVDNLDEYRNVIYRVEGKAYASGHIELGIDEVYLGDN